MKTLLHPLALLAVALFTFSVPTWAQAPGKTIKLDVQWVVEKDGDNGEVTNLIDVRPKTADGRLLTGQIVQGTPKIGLIRLVKRVGHTDTRIGVKLVGAQAAIVTLQPEGRPEKDGHYLLFVDSAENGQPGIVLRENGTPLVYANPSVVKLVDTDTPFDRHRDFGIKDKRFNPKGALSMLAGSGGGAIASAKLATNVTEVFWDNFLVHAEGKADIALQPRDFDKSFNSVDAELSLVYINEDKREWPVFGRGSRQFSLGAKFASDRAFETMDVSGSLGAWLTMDNIVTRAIANALFRINQKEHEPAPSALWRFSYDYAAKVQSGSGNSARVTEVGENRGVVRLDWPLWIAREWDLTKTPLRGYYAIQLLIEEEGVWDIKTSKFLLKNKLTLDIGPDEPGHRLDPNYKKPSFTLSYVNGKAAPTFRHANEILAGMKLPF